MSPHNNTTLPATTRATSPKSSDDIGVNELVHAELAEMRKGTMDSSIYDGNNNISNAATIPTPTTNININNNGSHQSPQQQFFPAACRSLLLEIEGNKKCLDCGTGRPEWAAVSFGALVCIQCSGNHRSLGVQTSTVRHITMDHWTFPQVIKMLEGGNAQLQNFYERHALTEEAFAQKQKEQQQQQQQVPEGSNSDTTTTTTSSSSPPQRSPATAPSPPKQGNGPSVASPPRTAESANSNASSSSPPPPQPSSILTKDNLHVMRYKTKAALFYREQLDHHVQHLLQSGKPYQGRKDRKVKRRPLGTQRSSV